jgi:hypothetical protein
MPKGLALLLVLLFQQLFGLLPQIVILLLTCDSSSAPVNIPYTLYIVPSLGLPCGEYRSRTDDLLNANQAL